MERLKIALLQISPCGLLEGNLEKGIKICRQAKKMGADSGAKRLPYGNKPAVPAPCKIL